jgi:hypothetical protein
MVLGDVNRVRELSGKHSSDNLSDADISQYLLYGTAEVEQATGKYDWDTDTSNPLYPLAVMASEYFAASVSRDRFNDESDISTEFQGRANNIIRRIANNLFNSSTAGTAIAKGKYRSWPLNPNTTPFKSAANTNTGQEIIGAGDYKEFVPQ